MTNDLIDAYKNIFKDNKVVLDTYKLANGYYYLINSNNEMERIIVEKGQCDNPELYDYLKIRDYYSVYLKFNKLIDTTYKETINGTSYNMLKKIASTNIYTLFFKNKSIDVFGCIDKDEKKKEAVPIEFFRKGIDKYYSSLFLMGKDNKKTEEQYGYTEQEIKEYQDRMKKAFDIVATDFQKLEKPKDAWIKIFIDNSEEEYERVSNFYINKKIFNSDDNKILQNNLIYGINNYNFNANSKKPYLELKTTTYKIASLISTEDINILRRIYIWLYNNATQLLNIKLITDSKFNGVENNEKSINSENIFKMKVVNDYGTARIDSFEYVPNFSTDIVQFNYRNILKNDHEIIDSATNIYELERIVNKKWITHNEKFKENYIRDSYSDYKNKISSSKGLANWKKDFLQTYASEFESLFEKEEINIFLQKLNDMTINAVQNTLIDDYKINKRYLNNAKEALNLGLCLEKYFNKEEVNDLKINDVQERCKRIFNNDTKIEKDDEYYYFLGQVAYYLLSKSKAEKLTQDMTEPFIKANNIQILNRELTYLYSKYNYDISLKDKRFNNIYSQILLSKPETNVKDNKNTILAGMLSDNLFYTKKDGGNDYENE